MDVQQPSNQTQTAAGDQISPTAIGIAVTISTLLVVVMILLIVLLVICIRLKRNHAIVRQETPSLPTNAPETSLHCGIKSSRPVTAYTPNDDRRVEEEFTQTYPQTQRPKLSALSKNLVLTMQSNKEYIDSSVVAAMSPYNNINTPSLQSDSPNEDSSSYSQRYAHHELPRMLSKTGTLTPVYDDASFQLQTGHDSGSPLEVSVKNIKLFREIGVGNFGKVHLAETVGLTRNDLGLSDEDLLQQPALVAVKMLQKNASTDTLNAFEKECKFMSRLNHKNVIRLLAVCRSKEPFLLMEHMENGDLNTFLKNYKSITTDTVPPSPTSISQRVLLYMCLQVTSAMKYLASKNFVHRDLATRNCLVGRNFTIKVSDFGMSKNLYDSCYYLLQGQAMLPIRWMACECFSGRFSQKSDVWAFGVTMWEIFTLTSVLPYKSYSDIDLIKDAIRGPNRKLLERPEMCPEDVYHVMNCCWKHDPCDRGDFTELYTELRRLYNTDMSRVL